MIDYYSKIFKAKENDRICRKKVINIQTFLTTHKTSDNKEKIIEKDRKKQRNKKNKKEKKERRKESKEGKKDLMKV